ncbi:MAG: AAA family ATPase [Lachnospiraceae bacterium]|nr:AAA family ATPase [Lachnospiraceae bacterium]
MKPIKLIISAYGPYANKVEIGFEQFEDKGLFLITGDTGAGKTTIFDAICYALYGKTSGEYRDENQMRSDYAEDGAESYVEFYFMHQGREYHVRRWPACERLSAKVKRMVSQNEKAEFYGENEAPIEGIKQVDKRVKELLGIDRNQFKQIAMISQGEFWELLNAKTEKRTEILRTIFMTEGYKKIELKLKEHLSAANEKYKSEGQAIAQYFSEVTAEEGSEEAEMLHDQQKKIANSKSLESVVSVKGAEGKKGAEGVEGAEGKEGAEGVKGAEGKDGAEGVKGAEGKKGAKVVDVLLGSIERIEEADKVRHKLAQEERIKADKLLDEYKAKQAIAESNNETLARLAKLQKEAAELATQKESMQQKEAALVRQRCATRQVNPVYEAHAGKQKECAEKAAQIEEQQTKLTKAEALAKAAEERRLLAEATREEAEACKRRAEKIEEEKEKYTKRDTLRSEVKALAGQQQGFAEQESLLADKEQKLKEKTEQLKKIVGELQTRPRELVTVQTKTRQFKDLEEKLAELAKNRIPTWQKKQDSLQRKQGELIEAMKLFDQAEEERKEAERILECSRAGLLAQHLKNGEKCPVCGSTHHPEPAVLPVYAVTEEEYNIRAKKAEQRKTIKDSAVLAVETEKATLAEVEARLYKDILDCLESETAQMAGVAKKEHINITMVDLAPMLKLAQECVCAAREAGEKQEQEVLQDCKTLEKAQKELDQAQGQESEKLAEERAQHMAAVSRNATELSGKKATLATYAELSYADWNTAEKEQIQEKQKAKRIFDAIDRAMQEKTAADKKVEGLAATITTLKSGLERTWKEEQEMAASLLTTLGQYGFDSEEAMRQCVLTEEEIGVREAEIGAYKSSVETNASLLEQARKDAEGKIEIDIAALQEQVKRQRETVTRLQEIENKIAYRMGENRKKYDSIKRRQNSLETAKKDMDVSGNLYKLVTGQTGNGKITLEQYIQAAGFDSIIHAANRRLNPMSEGQYVLYRKDGALGKQTNTFLDLEVLDNYTGKRRPVGNLSGGESFKASLSLALGLSDTVSSNRGGVQMDALFIDEGFGTLDRKSIDCALDTLVNLSTSNKLVGVISHREELVDNIPQQIRVTKGEHGSVVEVVTGE